MPHLKTPGHRAAPRGRRLLADIGATYARFCIEDVPGRFEQVAVLACAEHAGFVEVVQAYLAGLAGERPRHAAVAIANPVEGDQVRMTNRDWAFSVGAAQRELGLATLLVVNNFTALAMSLPRLGPGGSRQVGAGTARAGGVIGLVGPGTGLGVSGLVPSGDRWVTLATEGGHVSFAPTDERELRVLRFAWRIMKRVSAERLISGPGIELIYHALAEDRAEIDDGLPTAEIVRRALAGDTLCGEAIDCFCGMLGTMASDLALTLGATGGIYLGGGIVPRLGSLFDRSPFRSRFESKGRFSGFVARIPTFVLTGEHPAFHGVSQLLSDHLPELETASPLLERVRASRDSLTPAERRVADYVVDHPRAALNDPVGAIAQGAQVSQPTVIRFCRSLGFEGLADFKLKLGSGLTGTLPVQRTQVRRQDSTADLCAKVIDNTITSIVQLRESLNVEAVARAIALLGDAARIEFFGIGNTAVVALDAHLKMFRFRRASAAHTDAATVAAAAELMAPQDVAVFVSTTGQAPELVRACGAAIERGVRVVAITAGQSPLARRATVCIPVDHAEGSTTFVAMVSRILYLLVVDMVSVGLAVQAEPAAADTAAATAEAPGAASGQISPAPGVLISHVA